MITTEYYSAIKKVKCNISVFCSLVDKGMENRYNKKSSCNSELMVQYDFSDTYKSYLIYTHKWEEGERKKLKLWDSALLCNRAIATLTSHHRLTKSQVPGMGCFFRSFWPVRVHRLPKLQNIVSVVGHPSELTVSPYCWNIKWLTSRWAHWSDHGMNSTEVTNNFLTGLTPTPQDETHTWHCGYIGHRP